MSCLITVRIAAAVWLLLASAGTLAAQQADSQARWTDLNGAVGEAYRAGDYDNAVELAEEAFDVATAAFGETHPDTLTSLNNMAFLYQAQGRYGEAEPLYERALELRRETLGETHPDTLMSLNNMAFLYQAQGRYGEAEPLYARALELFSETLGETHPDTLSSLNNMALLYHAQGRYGEAEPLFARALELRRETLGDTHPDTLTSLNNMAFLYQAQGRYGEAEPLYERALELLSKTLGETHPVTLMSLNNMAFLYQAQGRYGEAEPLYARALELFSKTLGEAHPDTLMSLNNMAGLHQAQGQYGEAEPLYARALELFRETLGETHPQTLTSLNNMAFLYRAQGRLGEAEPLYARALELFRETLGETHPQTLTSLNNMAFLYRTQGRFGEAEPIFAEAFVGARVVLGAAHPRTLLYQLNTTNNLAALSRPADAARLLAQMEGPLLTWLGAEIYATESPAVARNLVASQRTFQDVALSVAISFPEEPQARQIAASALLRFKGLQAEEEAVVARLVRRGRDDAMGALAIDVRRLRDRLARAFHGSADPEAVAGLTRTLDARERALGRLSRDYRDQLAVRQASLADLQGALTGGATLVEFARYRPADFEGGGFGPDRWAAVIVQGYDRLEVIDLGPVAGTEAPLAALVAETDGADAAARVLHDRLIAPLGLASDVPVVLAPDSDLHLLPFHRLILPEGGYWTEVQELGIVQTGRDLLRPLHDEPATGLLAIGGVDFDTAPVEIAMAEAMTPEPPPAALSSQVARSRSATADAFRSGFGPLPGSATEIAEIEALYRSARPAEPVEIWRGADASEARLVAHDRPPRVLHLATHGFYRAPRDAADRPMLLAGIALAGANGALAEDDADGLLYALEAQGLDLEGTELVVLSACETAQGVIGHGEGIYGLVRALRTAGAENILVTLRPIGDAGAATFMRRFYSEWLSQPPGRSEPARALRATRQHFIDTDPDFDWTPFVMVGT